VDGVASAARQKAASLLDDVEEEAEQKTKHTPDATQGQQGNQGLGMFDPVNWPDGSEGSNGPKPAAAALAKMAKEAEEEARRAREEMRTPELPRTVKKGQKKSQLMQSAYDKMPQSSQEENRRIREQHRAERQPDSESLSRSESSDSSITPDHTTNRPRTPDIVSDVDISPPQVPRTERVKQNIEPYEPQLRPSPVKVANAKKEQNTKTALQDMVEQYGESSGIVAAYKSRMEDQFKLRMQRVKKKMEEREWVSMLQVWRANKTSSIEWGIYLRRVQTAYRTTLHVLAHAKAQRQSQFMGHWSKAVRRLRFKRMCRVRGSKLMGQILMRQQKLNRSLRFWQWRLILTTQKMQDTREDQVKTSEIAGMAQIQYMCLICDLKCKLRGWQAWCDVVEDNKLDSIKFLSTVVRRLNTINEQRMISGWMGWMEYHHFSRLSSAEEQHTLALRNVVMRMIISQGKWMEAEAQSYAMRAWNESCLQRRLAKKKEVGLRQAITRLESFSKRINATARKLLGWNEWCNYMVDMQAHKDVTSEKMMSGWRAVFILWRCAKRLQVAMGFTGWRRVVYTSRIANAETEWGIRLREEVCQGAARLVNVALTHMRQQEQLFGYSTWVATVAATKATRESRMHIAQGMAVSTRYTLVALDRNLLARGWLAWAGDTLNQAKLSSEARCTKARFEQAEGKLTCLNRRLEEISKTYAMSMWRQEMSVTENAKRRQVTNTKALTIICGMINRHDLGCVGSMFWTWRAFLPTSMTSLTNALRGGEIIHAMFTAKMNTARGQAFSFWKGLCDQQTKEALREEVSDLKDTAKLKAVANIWITFHQYRASDGIFKWCSGVMFKKGKRSLQSYALKGVIRRAIATEIRSAVMEWSTMCRQSQRRKEHEALRKARHEAWGWGIAAVLSASRAHSLASAMARWKYVLSTRSLHLARDTAFRAGARTVMAFYVRGDEFVTQSTFSFWRTWTLEERANRALIESKQHSGINILNRMLITHRTMGVARSMRCWQDVVTARHQQDAAAASAEAVKMSSRNAAASVLRLVLRVLVVHKPMRASMVEWELNCSVARAELRNATDRVVAGMTAIRAVDRAQNMHRLTQWMSMWKDDMFEAREEDAAQQAADDVAAVKKLAALARVESRESMWKFQGLADWQTMVKKHRHNRALKTMGVKGIALMMIQSLDEWVRSTMYLGWTKWTNYITLEHALRMEDQIIQLSEATEVKLDAMHASKKGWGSAFLFHGMRREVEYVVLRAVSWWRRGQLGGWNRAHQWSEIIQGVFDKEQMVRRGVAFSRWIALLGHSHVVHAYKVGEGHVLDEKKRQAGQLWRLSNRLSQHERSAYSFRLWHESLLDTKYNTVRSRHKESHAAASVAHMITDWQWRVMTTSFTQWCQCVHTSRRQKIADAQVYAVIRTCDVLQDFRRKSLMKAMDYWCSVRSGGTMAVKLKQSQWIIKVKTVRMIVDRVVRANMELIQLVWKAWLACCGNRSTVAVGIAMLANIIVHANTRCLIRAMRAWDRDLTMNKNSRSKVSAAVGMMENGRARALQAFKRRIIHRWKQNTYMGQASIRLSEVKRISQYSGNRSLARVYLKRALNIAFCKQWYAFDVWCKLSFKDRAAAWRRKVGAKVMAKHVSTLLQKFKTFKKNLAFRSWCAYTALTAKVRNASAMTVKLHRHMEEAMIPVALSSWRCNLRKGLAQARRRQRKGYSVSQVRMIRMLHQHAHHMALTSKSDAVSNWWYVTDLRKVGACALTKWLVTVIRNFHKQFLIELVKQWRYLTTFDNLTWQRNSVQTQACGKGLVMMMRIVKTNTHNVFLQSWGAWKAITRMASHMRAVKLKVMLLGSTAGHMQREYTGVLAFFTTWKGVTMSGSKQRAHGCERLAQREAELERSRFVALTKERVSDYTSLLVNISKLQAWFHSALRQVAEDHESLMDDHSKPRQFTVVGMKHIEKVPPLQQVLSNKRSGFMKNLSSGEESVKMRIQDLNTLLQALTTGDAKYADAMNVMKRQKQCGESLVKQMSAEVEDFNEYLNSAQIQLHEAATIERRSYSEEIDALRVSHAEEVHTLQSTMKKSADVQWRSLQGGLEVVQEELFAQESDAKKNEAVLSSEIIGLRSELEAVLAEKELVESALQTERSYFEVELSKRQGQVEDAEDEAVRSSIDIHDREKTVLKELSELQEECRKMRYREETSMREKGSISNVLSRLRQTIENVKSRHEARYQAGASLTHLEQQCNELAGQLQAPKWLSGLFPALQQVLSRPHPGMEKDLASIVSQAEKQHTDSAKMMMQLSMFYQQILSQAQEAIYSSMSLEEEIADYANVFLGSTAMAEFLADDEDRSPRALELYPAIEGPTYTAKVSRHPPPAFVPPPMAHASPGFDPMLAAMAPSMHSMSPLHPEGFPPMMPFEAMLPPQMPHEPTAACRLPEERYAQRETELAGHAGTLGQLASLKERLRHMVTTDHLVRSGGTLRDATFDDVDQNHDGVISRREWDQRRAR